MDDKGACVYKAGNTKSGCNRDTCGEGPLSISGVTNRFNTRVWSTGQPRLVKPKEGSRLTSPHETPWPGTVVGQRMGIGAPHMHFWSQKSIFHCHSNSVVLYIQDSSARVG